ncbi:hypothetical protein KNE206_40180 [Kitasatospora sp. NE20-6]|uniref:NUDIX domain-containing protein n=1 Tax=Kitasatospora sp. NE20-6 TaxID=2859066 RepID=UPI0034DC0298
MAPTTPTAPEAPLRPFLPAAQFTAGLPRHVVSAALLLTDPAGRVLMLHQARPYPGHPAWWQLPGGLADDGERPHETAVRETREETGIVADGPPRLLAVDHRAAADGWPQVIDFCFDGGVLPAGTPIALSTEHDTHAWRSPAAWRPLLQPAQRPWFRALSRARRAGVPLLLSDGVEPSAAPGVRPGARTGA